MITLFTVPKPFDGEIGAIQRNALRSWAALGDVQLVVLGDEPGAAEAAAEVGADHVPAVARSSYGTPLLDDAFARVEALARWPLRCFVNCDIVLLDDFIPAVRTADRHGELFLMIGRSLDLPVDGELRLERPEVRAQLRARALAGGRSRGATAIDYFAFGAGLFDTIPAFAVGRACFDNWLVWEARRRGVVYDASRYVVAVHQHHDYRHLAGGAEEAHFGVEAARNRELAGGGRRLYTIHDASHLIDARGRVQPNLGATLRLRENLRKAAWKLSRR